MPGSSASTRRPMGSLTRLLRSIVLAFTVGLWAFSLVHLVREGTDAPSAGFSRMLLCCIPAWLLCWRILESGSGPTTPLTTATLLRTRGWKSVGSKTRSSGSAWRSRVAPTTDSKGPSSGPWDIPPALVSWTWCRTKQLLYTPEGALSGDAFAVLHPAVHALLRTGSTTMVYGALIRECRGGCSHRCRD
jgi:hypothetical protein